MAYAVLLSLTQTITRILRHDDHPISVNGKQQMETLRRQAIHLQEFLEMFPKESLSLETRIRDTANQAEDVMEHFMYEHTRSNLKAKRLKEVGRDVRPAEDIEYDFRELEYVTNEISSIAEQAAAIEKESGGRPATQPLAASSAPKTAPVIDTVTIGLEKKVEDIRGLLCKGQPERRVIPITGMGGIGKTTLARVVYNDDEVMRAFPLRAWIVVSQNYKPENIFADLLFSLENKNTKALVQDGDTTEDKLHKILTTMKYLIVLDDLWSEKAWDDIKKVFGNPRKRDGSRIVITTRNEKVASHADSSSRLQRMDLMNEANSWALLKHKVFPKEKFPSHLEAIGKDVSKNCGGLPLAIVLVAGILFNVAKTRTAWEEIAKDVRAAVEGKEEFGKIISLSYTHLPLNLRPSFIYMGGFPEDHEIRISKLMKLWIAEGFVKDEEEAEEYLNNLVTRNLPTVTTSKSDGKFKSCNVHDLVRDMSKRNALDENYERRLSIAHRDLTRLARSYASTIRTVLSFQPNESSLGGLRKFKLLRVLDVVDTDAYSLPAPVFELFHLRYLAFGCPMEVPYAISRLQNLRALIIRPSKRLRHHSTDEVYLPLEIWMLPLLKHLVSFFDLLPNPEEAASALKELATLTVVKKLICTEEMMEMISNVKKLGITYFGDRYKQDYQLQNLVLLQNLEKLTLIVKKESPLDQQKAKPVFPETLRKLTLSGWRFPWRYMKAVASLPHLQVLKLRDRACEGERWDIDEEIDDEESDEESDGEADVFPELEYLLIDESDIKECVMKKDNFPKLKRLVFHDCDELSEIADDVGNIATLELIEVDRDNTSLVACVQGIRKRQKEEFDRTLKIREL